MRLAFRSTRSIGPCVGGSVEVAAPEPVCAGAVYKHKSVGDWIGPPKRKVPQMRRNRVLNCVTRIGLLSIFLTASFAMARDNDDKKDRSNQGGRSSSNSNNSGNSGSSSSRSMSSSNDSSRGFISRSSQSIQIPSSDRSSRSFSSGNSSDGATFSGKSFSGLSSRSSDDSSSTIRSSGSQTVARPIDGAIFNGGGGTNSSPFQGFSG